MVKFDFFFFLFVIDLKNDASTIFILSSNSFFLVVNQRLGYLELNLSLNLI